MLDDEDKEAEAITWYRSALAMLSKVGDRKWTAESMNALALADYYLSAYDSAKAYNYRAMAIQRELPDTFGLAETLANLGSVYEELGRRDSAVSTHANAILLQERIGDVDGVIISLGSLGTSLESLGLPDSATTVYHRAMSLALATNDTGHVIENLIDIGSVLDDVGLPDSALAYDSTAVVLARRTNDRSQWSSALQQMAGILLRAGNGNASLDSYRESYRLSRQASKTGLADTDVLDGLGDIFAQRGLPDSAFKYYHEELDAAKAEKDPDGVATAFSNLGVAFSSRGMPDSAVYFESLALKARNQIHDQTGTLISLRHLSDELLDRGLADSAHALATEALGFARAGGDRRLQSEILIDLAAIDTWMSTPDDEESHLTQALNLARQTHYRAAESRTLSLMADLLRIHGEFDSSAVCAREALRIARVIHNQQKEAAALEASANLSSGLGKYREAREADERALSLWDSVGDSSRASLARLRIGYQLASENQVDSAIIRYRESLAGLQQAGDVIQQPYVLNALANAERRQGKLDAAHEDFLRSKQIAESADARSAIRLTYNDLGFLMDEEQFPDSALTYLHTAANLAHAALDWSLEATALSNIAFSYQRRRDRRLDSAVAYYAKSAAIRRQVFRQTRLDGDRITLAEQSTGIFSRWALAWLGRAATPGLSTRSSNLAALAVAERGRAQSLLELMHDTSLVSSEEPSDSLLVREGTEHVETIASAGRSLDHFERLAADTRPAGRSRLRALRESRHLRVMGRQIEPCATSTSTVGRATSRTRMAYRSASWLGSSAASVWSMSMSNAC